MGREENGGLARLRDNMKDAFPASICLIDDDSDFVAFLSKCFEARGCAVMTFDSAEAFLETPKAMDMAFFLVDLTLPGADGVDLVSIIRAQVQAGIIVITDRMGPDAFSSALAAGADMFINKPVRFDQVYQAILSVTRRIGAARFVRRSWMYDEAMGLLRSPTGSNAKLTKTERKLLATLLEANGTVVDRPTLAKAGNIVASKDDRNLDAAMFRMRRRIEQTTQEAAPLRTIHGGGYAVADIERAKFGDVGASSVMTGGVAV